MQNNSFKRIFNKVFRNALLYILIFTLSAIGIYITATKLLSDSEEIENHNEEDYVEISIASKVSIGKKQVNLIYEANTENKLIDHILVEIFNVHTANLDYVTIPTDTKVKLSDKTFEKIKRKYLDINNEIVLADLFDIFKTGEVYEYGRLVIGDLLGIDINYYTVMNKAVFTEYFTTKDRKYTDINGNEIKYNTIVCSDIYLYQMSQLNEDNIDKNMIELYSKIESNLALQNKIKYTKDYLKINPEYIHVWHIYGCQEDYFIPDNERNNTLAHELLGGFAYTEKQE